MPEPFTSDEQNMTVWQRLDRVLSTAMHDTPGNYETILRAVHAHVVRERADARRGDA